MFGLMILQNVKGQSLANNLDTTQILTLDTNGYFNNFASQKRLLPGYEFACLVALSKYPELKTVEIEFVTKKTDIPLMATPTFWSIFRRKSKRTFQVQISEKSKDFLESILLKNLSLNAQIGVLGHELGHIADMKSFSFWRFLIHGIRYTISDNYGDQFEFRTDRIAVQHGLGLPLYCWSSEVRRKLKTGPFAQEIEKNDKRERYMNPGTILKEIEEIEIHNPISKKL